jgi:hypothetical protein
LYRQKLTFIKEAKMQVTSSNRISFKSDCWPQNTGEKVQVLLRELYNDAYKYGYREGHKEGYDRGYLDGRMERTKNYEIPKEDFYTTAFIGVAGAVNTRISLANIIERSGMSRYKLADHLRDNEKLSRIDYEFTASKIPPELRR